MITTPIQDSRIVMGLDWLDITTAILRKLRLAAKTFYGTTLALGEGLDTLADRIPNTPAGWRTMCPKIL